ncbi:MoaD/ThiS family protein [Corynebacterium mendelii]|uniref:MoaD/ThiS family protein n=1 Tax=Corynebacterium mendelii TaxID=2765362 RepID=A0A939DZR5_9CORY|nr:MoaD/ThiS family protein [Corynebacterium mendelii]MBN9643826.1 MoaD/ThiS family protein [Corynebacterium mendelii]
MATVRFFAAAKEAARCGEKTVPATDLVGLKQQLEKSFGDGFSRVLQQSSWLVDGVRVPMGDNRPIGDDTVVDVLPPFAGG